MLRWTDGCQWPARALLLRLLERARDGLDALGVDAGLAEPWLALLRARLEGGINGARWQLDRLDQLGGDLAALTLDYARHQAGGMPIHLWR